MPVDIDIAHVARLARLDLSEAELEGYKTQLGAILDHAAKVQALKGNPHVESEHPLGLVNTYREDETRPSLDREEVLSQAPESRDGYFVAPPAKEVE
ncbi:MAG TPA: Asp-tRNA(Asn)/Glu-tRNA(Gln) amidotransferase subunit GatC [Acidimicrobiia bacterium]|nr:Asp-tRNA(Asn)/Glu-tRNA(Gln) amidotransferase subunit GatC [Acidimicrobiia bacterium]